MRRRLLRGPGGILRTKTVLKRVAALLRTPLFWIISIWGNLWILIGALAFHLAESGRNEAVGSFLDSLLWAVGIVTTVGSGNVFPITVAGKIVSMAMMFGGAVFLWSYMALFVGALVDPELRYIESEVAELQQEVEVHQEPRTKRTP